MFQLLTSLLRIINWGVLSSAVIFILWILVKLLGASRRKAAQKRLSNKFSIGFFHPYCNAGGGGERVLWVALKFMLEKYPNYRYIIYTGDVDVSSQRILQNAKARFNIDIQEDAVEFIYLNRRSWVEAYRYPHFTLLGQSIGSVFLGVEALEKFVPDVFLDTMGYAFTLPIFKFLGQAKVACYTHYPTISTDMLERVANRTAAHNNDDLVSRSDVLSQTKLIYYRLFSIIYSWAGRFSDVIMVNSSWTQGHINSLWQCPAKTARVYPPCDVEEFKRIKPKAVDTPGGQPQIRILSVAQFRPEKDHALQIQSLSVLKDLVEERVWRRVKLVLVGSCRGGEDAGRVEELRKLSRKLRVEDNVEFRINVAFAELKEEMSEGMIGIHTMWNEHFGIGVVECMAAGLIMLAHRSGGPMMDIVEEGGKNRTGFLASTAEEYAKTILKIINMSAKERVELSNRAKASVDRFSESRFTSDFLKNFQQILPNN